MHEQKMIVRDFFDRVVYYTPYDRRYVDRTNLNAYDILKRKDVVLECLDRLEARQGRLLDVGCGPAVYAPDLAARGFEVWGIDLAPGVVARGREIMARTPWADRCHFQVGDIERLDFPDRSFDVVLVIGLFDYLPSDEPALRQMLRLLRPGGLALISLQNRFSYQTAVRGLVWPLRPLFRLLFGEAARSRELTGDHVTKTHQPRDFHRTAMAMGLRPVLEDWTNFNLIPFNLPGALPRIYFRLHDLVNDSRVARRRLPWLFGSYLVALRLEEGRP